LTWEKPEHIHPKNMLRILAIGLALVVVLSCAAVLISPDFCDDVDGAVHHLVKKHKLVPASAVRLRPFVLDRVRSFTPLTSVVNSNIPDLLDLVCARLC
jgi:hypothetical protein